MNVLENEFPPCSTFNYNIEMRYNRYMFARNPNITEIWVRFSMFSTYERVRFQHLFLTNANILNYFLGQILVVFCELKIVCGNISILGADTAPCFCMGEREPNKRHIFPNNILIASITHVYHSLIQLLVFFLTDIKKYIF